MGNYTLKYKLLRYEQEILDENLKIIGYAKRYYRHIGQRFFMLFDPTSVLNVRVENEVRQPVLEIKSVSRILAIRKRWEGIIYSNPDVSFSLTLDPKLKIGFYMELQIGDKTVFIKDRTLGTEPNFLDSDNNILAKCRDDLVGNVKINITDSSLNVYLVSAITYLMRQY